MFTRTLRIVFVMGLLLLASAGGGWAQKYVVTEIGALPDLTPTIPTPPTSGASALNAYGLAVGTSAISGGFLWITPDRGVAEPWLNHAVLWADELYDLGVLGKDVPPDVFPRPASAAHSINNYAQVVGDAT